MSFVYKLLLCGEEGTNFSLGWTDILRKKKKKFNNNCGVCLYFDWIIFIATVKSSYLKNSEKVYFEKNNLKNKIVFLSGPVKF